MNTPRGMATVNRWRGRVFQVGGRQSEKLDHRRLTAVYGGQAVMTSTLIVGGIESRGPRAGRVHRPGIRRCRFFAVFESQNGEFVLNVFWSCHVADEGVE